MHLREYCRVLRFEANQKIPYRGASLKVCGPGTQNCNAIACKLLNRLPQLGWSRLSAKRLTGKALTKALEVSAYLCYYPIQFSGQLNSKLEGFRMPRRHKLVLGFLSLLV